MLIIAKIYLCIPKILSISYCLNYPPLPLLIANILVIM